MLYGTEEMRRSHLALAEERDPDDDRVPAHPFLKWAGGKWSIAPRIERLLPRDVRDRPYREPFMGGAAMFFYLQPRHAVLCDALRDLVETYKVVQFHVDALISRLGKLRETHSTEQFYEIRTRFNEERDAPRVERASWLIYLNKTCFNGLFRTNRDGNFNVPVGKFVNPGILDANTLRYASLALADAEIHNETFEHLVNRAEPGDMIYLDPPYVPLSKTASFCAYSDGAFTLKDQERLAEVYRELDARGCLLALSNSDTPDVRRLYEGYDFSQIVAPRAISSKAATRGEVMEVVVRNLSKYPRK